MDTKTDPAPPSDENDRIESNDSLKLYLKQISSVFDLASVFDAPREKPQVISHYLVNKISHSWVSAGKGFCTVDSVMTAKGAAGFQRTSLCS